MTRYIVLGNGSMLLCIDRWLQVRDFYFPHVGEENHLLGHAHKIGIYADKKISWVNDNSWKKTLSYKPNTLVSDCRAVNDHIKIGLSINDCVDCDKNIFIRQIDLKNNADFSREVKIFFYQDFHLYGSGIGDTAGYDPSTNSVFHYKRKRHFLINAIKFPENHKKEFKKGDIYEYSVGTADLHTIKDADDGNLDKNPIAQGEVDSIISLKIKIAPHSSEKIYYWICCGHDFNEVLALNKLVLEKKPQVMINESELCSIGIANKCKIRFGSLNSEVIDNFKKSILVIKTHIDAHGAIIAGTDSDNLQFNRDTYNYVWMRDGALVALSLQKAGYSELAENFYLFCSKSISSYGCFLHKYNPDGSLGSSWHPWIKDGKPQLPIQEDETALVIYSLGDYYSRTKDTEFVRKLYVPLIEKAADFMVKFRDPETGLPLESYDLWEERQGVLTFTCASVYAGLKCASELSAAVGNKKKSEEYEKAAQEVKDATIKYLYDNEKKRFLRRINFKENKIIKDFTLDSSIYSISEFGLLEIDDFRVQSTFEALKEGLWISTNIGGMARYENDNYHKVFNGNDSVTGNPWIICTAWLGKYYVAKAKKKSELKDALSIIAWILDNSLSTGIMPEQVNPFTGEPLSVSPLVWSHAEFIDLVINYTKKLEELKE